MKNKLLTILTLTILTGSLLVGCGGNETDNGGSTNTEANVNTESNTTVKINPNIGYTETAIAFLVTNEADTDKSMVDGTEVPDVTQQGVEYKVTFKEPINLYAKDKSIIGYVKPDVKVAFGQFSNDWCLVGSTDYTEVYYVLTSDAVAVMEIVEEPNAVGISDDEKEESNTMSDKVKTYFDKIRQGVNETNAYRKSYVAEHPEVPFTEIIETTSLEGMEFIGGFDASFDDEQTIENAVSLITFENNGNYTQYYLEFIKETDNSVEFYIYAK